MIRYLILALILACSGAQAANRFVRAGASGNGSGSDWTNAHTTLPATLTRGDTYYIADDTSIGSYQFDDAANGQLIRVKKCVGTDHGSAADYVATYCDGQASFGELTFVTDDYHVSGMKRDESAPPASWKGASSYGLTATGVTANSANYGTCPDNITVEYVAITSGAPPSGRPIFIGYYCSNWVIGKNYIYTSGGDVSFSGISTVTYEYNYQYQTWGKECVRGQNTATNATIRYNVFDDCCRDDHSPGEGCTAEVAFFANQGSSPDFEGLRIYGNIIWKKLSQHKSDGSLLGQANDCAIYNNTISDDSDTGLAKLMCGVTEGAAGSVRNNITFVPNGMSASYLGGTADNNSTYTASPPFTNVSTGDFSLTGSLAGVSLTNPFNLDMKGYTRGGDGIFDRGAIEYGTSSGNPPGPVTDFDLARVPLWIALRPIWMVPR